MDKGDQQAYAARQLWAGAFHALLSTHSREHPGYPFGSLVPYMLADDGSPVMLLSHLSQHTRNADADGRCGFTVIEHGSGDVQQLGRLSAVGDIWALAAEAAPERFFDYFPQSRMYHEQLGFRFYRFEAQRFHWNGGFATARWFDPARIQRGNPLDPEGRRAVLAHMNREHGDALRSYLGGRVALSDDTQVAMVGLDREGIDLRVDDALYRVPLVRELGSLADARAVLVEMATGDGRD